MQRSKYKKKQMVSALLMQILILKSKLFHLGTENKKELTVWVENTIQIFILCHCYPHQISIEKKKVSVFFFQLSLKMMKISLI